MRWQIIKPSKDFYRLSVSDNLGLVILADSGTSEIIVELNRPGAQALVLGVFNSRQDENLNLKVITIHSHANTHAETMIHGLVGGQAQAQIKGLIQIKKNARQVTDFLTERIILLSDKARAIAEPELEIETDEVRASHAATVPHTVAERVPAAPRIQPWAARRFRLRAREPVRDWPRSARVHARRRW